MRKGKDNLKELRQKMKDLQEKISNKERELNIEIGAWCRHETNLDTLSEIRENFRLVPINNNPQKTLINTQTTAPFGADLTPKSAC